MTQITIAGLNRRFGPLFAVEDVNLEIAEGEFLTLLGPSGSGKTTTLRMVAGLERPDAGTITVGGRTMNAPGLFVPPHQRNMGMVFQSYAIWPHRTVYENVAFPLRMKRVSRAEERDRVARMLDLVELPAADFGARFASALSGGQQQRVSLARALVADPDVILYDEPLSNLDARLRDAMRGLLRSIHGRIRTTALYVTHDQIEAMVLSDRVCVMNKGRIVQQDAPRALYDRPADAFVAEFIGQANLVELESADSATGRVTLPGGAVIRVENWPTKTPTRLVLRHHQTLLAPSHGTAENTIPAIVDDAVFLGDRVRYSLRVSNVLVLTAELLAEAGLPVTGDAVRIRLPAETCILI
jgi:ABC-type Fe3+/spermidine/putrescine transport system ATPase subunit